MKTKIEKETPVAGKTTQKMNPELEKLRLPGSFFADSSRPIELEIGCGKGKFLVERARNNPDINFVGIDRVLKWMKRGIYRAGRKKLENLVFLKVEAGEFIDACIPDGLLSIVHIYFPDPWPKRRHRKRRLINPAFLKQISTKIKPGGFMEIATDHADYFEHIRKAVHDPSFSWKAVRESSSERLFEAALKTNYELKYELQGRKLNYIEVQV